MSLSRLTPYSLSHMARSSVPRQPGLHRGHAHFWHRAMSRRHVLGAAAAGGGLALGGGLLTPHMARAAQMEAAMPKPIPGGFDPMGTGEIIHLVLPGEGVELSTIGDFRGSVGITHIGGEGTVTTGGGGGGMSTPTASGDRLLFDSDMRFLKGLYVGEDGEEHDGTFAFI